MSQSSSCGAVACEYKRARIAWNKHGRRGVRLFPDLRGRVIHGADGDITMQDALIGAYMNADSSLMLLHVGYAPAGGGDAYGARPMWKPFREK